MSTRDRMAEREEADRRRPVVARKMGQPAYPTWTLVIPSWLTREIAGDDAPGDVMSRYQWQPELTDEGILYRPVRIETTVGW